MGYRPEDMGEAIGSSAMTDAAHAVWPVEVAGLAGRLDRASLAFAAKRANELRVGADEVLLASGAAQADEIAQAAATRLGLALDPLESGDDGAPAIAGRNLVSMLRSGVLRHADGRLTIAARGPGLRRLAISLARDPAMAGRIRLTTPERLAAYAKRIHGARLAARAAFRLRMRQPALSAATLGWSRYLLALCALMLAAAPFSGHIMPVGLVMAGTAVMAALLLGWTSLRVMSCVMPDFPDRPLPRDDAALPVYSLIVPLYREASVAPKLVAALRRLDYPPEKLQILLAVESDDTETREALKRCATGPCFEIVTVPDIGPRTKPKALNVALTFARGSLIAVYDAEDEPDPLQLRRAHAAFQRRGAKRVACVQARLVIDNAADSWITKQFAAEYAGQFDLLLPMLASLRLPFPLGGTSNHFRRQVLEEVGGWDPFNVTEDADLGVRLARAGWRSAVIASATEEEAPITFGAWLRQRTRWYKGWLQTLLVHGRRPLSLLAQLGVARSAALFVLIGGGVVSALVHPFFVAAFLLQLFAGLETDGSLMAALIEGMGIGILVAGYGSAALFAAAGMRRRQLPGVWLVVPLIPLYWLMLSLAAWRALGQLVRDPYRWEKTEHGLARTSRRDPAPHRATGSGADRRRPRQADA